jgi:hypothetical protein
VQNQHHYEVAQNDDNHGYPNDDAIAVPEVQGHEVRANGRLDKEHRVDVQALRYKDDVQLVGSSSWNQPPWICHQSALATSGGEDSIGDAPDKIEDLFTVSEHGMR